MGFISEWLIHFVANIRQAKELSLEYWKSIIIDNASLLWQPSRPASLSLAGLTLRPIWLERWFATRSVLLVQVRNPVGLLVSGSYIGGWSAGLGQFQSVPIGCTMSLAWHELRGTSQGCLEQLRKGGMWQPTKPASLLLAGLTLCPNAGSRFWMCYQPRFEIQWDYWCREVYILYIWNTWYFYVVYWIPCYSAEEV